MIIALMTKLYGYAYTAKKNAKNKIVQSNAEILNPARCALTSNGTAIQLPWLNKDRKTNTL